MTQYLLDIENYMVLIEPVVKKYRHIENIEYCLFSNKLRYPLLDKSDCNELFRQPQMSLYCGPMMRIILKYIFATSSRYARYFFSKENDVEKNSLMDGFTSGVNTETIIKAFCPDITIEDIDYIEKIVCDIKNYISTLGIPFDYIIDVNDEYMQHIITIKEHILFLRLLELEELVKENDTKNKKCIMLKGKDEIDNE